MKTETLKTYPELENLLNTLGTYLTDAVMQELNYQVDELGRSPERVAREFLQAQGLI